MENDASGKGIKKVCSICKYTLLSEGKFFGLGSFKLKCANKDCQQYQRIVIGQKFSLAVSGIALIFAFFGYQAGEIQAKKNINCSTFKTHAEAQAMYDSDPVKYQALDKNYNKIACEDLIK